MEYGVDSHCCCKMSEGRKWMLKYIHPDGQFGGWYDCEGVVGVVVLCSSVFMGTRRQAAVLHKLTEMPIKF